MNNTYTASPRIDNCTFESNTADVGGGGISNSYGATPVITGCSFTQNVSGLGGGIRSWNSKPLVENSTFLENEAEYGGAFYSTNGTSAITITNCLFLKNVASENGGGLYQRDYAPVVANCNFIQNVAYGVGGGGGLFSSNSSMTISNSIFWDNRTSELDGKQISQNSDDTNVPVVTYCNIEGGYTGTGNIDIDPRFVNLADGNLRLSESSQCIDTGDSTLLPPDAADMDADGNVGENIPFDLDGNPRVSGSQVDIGAYEYQ